MSGQLAEAPLTIAFGRFAGGKICGRYHAPLAPMREGVVLCNPSGVEDVWTYATYRALAERLAAHGFPVLRFDYHGQGDSSGDDRDPGRVQAWKDSVAFAIDELVRRSSVTAVSLFGLRLGATLAATVAAERGGVKSLALWAPLAGRTFVREFRAYRLLNPPAPAPARLALREGDEEAAGFLLASETIAALGDLDLAKLAQKPAARALLLGKDETSNEEKVTKRLESLGVDVTYRRVPGYTAMMIEPRKSVRPDEALELVTSWLCEDPPPEAPDAVPAVRLDAAPVVVSARAPYTGGEVREEALHFGPREQLFGVVTEPIEKGPRAKTALILLTIAYHHRVGANRMHVAFAREAAALGFSALRFDIRGVGESRSPTGPPHPYTFEPLQDIAAAMDALAKRGVTRFVLAGLCSGAFLAYHGALADPRVSGAILLNPQIFYFKEGDSLDVRKKDVFKSTRTYRQLLTSPETWKRLVRGEINVRPIAGKMLERGVRLVEARLGDALGRWRGGPSKAPSVRRDFEALCRRGCRVLLVYSASDEGLDYIEAHLGKDGKAMRRFGEFEIQVIDGPDHTFAPVWSQQRVSEILCEHLEERFG